MIVTTNDRFILITSAILRRLARGDLLVEYYDHHPAALLHLMEALTSGEDVLVRSAVKELHDRLDHCVEEEACRRWQAGER
jgi:hypothetical protein